MLAVDALSGTIEVVRGKWKADSATLPAVEQGRIGTRADQGDVGFVDSVAQKQVLKGVVHVFGQGAEEESAGVHVEPMGQQQPSAWGNMWRNSVRADTR